VIWRRATPGAGPTVVFEPGLGSTRAIWGLVQPQVAEHAPTLVYDRAGYGASPEDPAPRTLARLADDLVTLIAGPVVLVGHSYGGPIVQAAAARAPQHVRGVVLVDPTPTDDPAMQGLWHRTLAPALYRPAGWLLPLRPIRRRLTENQLPEPYASEFRALEGSRRTLRAARREYEHFATSLAQVPPLPEGIPVAQVLPQPGAGHMVPLQDPDAIVAEVLRQLASRA
jgi:pimeloyl-ACP methyl ester carboxylesterase